MLSAIITGPIIQGFIPPELASGGQSLQFPSSSLVSLIAMPVDIVANESFTKKTEVTSSPVESGADVSDHVVQRPDTLKVELVVSDTPVSLFFAGAFPARGIISPRLDAMTFLDNLVEQRQPFDFLGIMQLYKNYVMTEWNPVATAKDGSILRFTCEMKKVRIVYTETVITPHVAARKKKTAATKVSLGTQNTLNSSNTMSLGASRWGGTFQSISPTQTLTPDGFPHIPALSQ